MRTSLTAVALLGVGIWIAGCASSSGPSGDLDGGGPSADAMACVFDQDCVDDGLFCNGSFVCREQKCVATDPPNCADGVACTVDSCDEARAGCINLPTDSLCEGGFVCREGQGCIVAPACEFDSDCHDDSFVCNGVPKCVANECVSARLDCADAQTCTADSCAEGSGGCVHDPYDSQNDPLHCGPSCAPCPLPTAEHQVPTCTNGVCGVACEPGHWDVDGLPGCEVQCPTNPATTPDVPDDGFLDQNCDGIDGTVADGIFVASDGSNGNPGTREFPVKTITVALSKAQSASKKFVYVAAGTYNETVTAANGIGVYGGYLRASAWRRDGTRAVITGQRQGAVKATNINAPTVFEYLEIHAATSTVPSKSSHGLVIVSSTAFVPRFLTIVAGDGAPGLIGSAQGATGDDGGNGSVGANGYEDDAFFTCAGNQVDPPLTYSGGASCTGGSTKGGDGKRGCITNSSSGCAGTSGDPGNTSGAMAGAGGIPVNSGQGGDGQPGANGARGGNGAGGTGGSVVSAEWSPAAGGSGGRGQDGGGGGGGAGGGSDHSTGTCNDWGGGGGGGGAGGCGGTPGSGGTGGGGSIGVLIVGSTVAAESVDVMTGAGGNGGDGRGGGGGGPAGTGVMGGAGNDESRGGGRGGDGGHGGGGGDGGGGGGGWSVCVYVTADSTFDDGGNASYSPGAPGVGGQGPGNSGLLGLVTDVLHE